MLLTEWARTWAVSDAALADLRARLFCLDAPPPAELAGRSEAAVQAAVRVEASKLGRRVWRNNVGAFHDPESGSFVRFGLANDSKAVNDRIKSADLIGIAPRLIQPEDLGHVIGQFVSYEIKAGDWEWSGSERERAQLAWAMLVRSLGGDARFVTGPGQI